MTPTDSANRPPRKPSTHAAPARTGRTTSRTQAQRRADPARRVAFRVLREVTEQDAYANLVLPIALSRADLSGRDAALATELTYGTLRGRLRYDTIIAAHIDRPLADLDAAVLDALRLGAHQLLAMRIPAHAAVSATIDAARSELGGGASGFVNAVLRKIAAITDAEDYLKHLSANMPPDDQLAVTTSHPAWVVRALRDSLVGNGISAVELPELLACHNEAAAVTLTALPGLCERAELTDPDNTGTGDAAQPTPYSPYGATITGAPGTIPAVAAGRARVQDEGSQLVALALALAPVISPDTGYWLDMCAGPGGKAALLGAILAQRRAADSLPPTAQLLATDDTAHRAQLVRQSVAAINAAPAGPADAPAAVRVEHLDARSITDRIAPGSADRILLDAPCTGLGALRRRPEARWRRTPADVGNLAALQRELLTEAVAAVRVGGIIAYVTCSPHLAETHAVVKAAIAAHPQLQVVPAWPVLAEAIAPAQLPGHPDGPFVQLWPHRHNTDAMFLALLRRTR